MAGNCDKVIKSNDSSEIRFMTKSDNSYTLNQWIIEYYDGETSNLISDDATSEYKECKTVQSVDIEGVGPVNGGVCTCPDGYQYDVADKKDNCATLACINGTPGTCNPQINSSTPSPYAFKSVHCDLAELIPRKDTVLFRSYKY